MGGVNVVEPSDDGLTTTITDIDAVDVVVGAETRARQRITVADNETRYAWAEALGVLDGVTETVVTLAGEDNLRLVGFSATGTGDARFRLVVDAAPVQGGLINRTSPVLSASLPAGIPLPLGSTAEVRVTGAGIGLCDYEATIYGEVTHG